MGEGMNQKEIAKATGVIPDEDEGINPPEPPKAEPIPRKDNELDGKFVLEGKLRKRKNGEEVPASHFMVFGIWDKHLVATLKTYRGLCAKDRASMEQVTKINDLIKRIVTGQEGMELKLADVDKNGY